MTWWHGGPRFDGDVILPPSATGRRRIEPVDTAVVYVTPHRHLAIPYAIATDGLLYRVAPDGLEPDPTAEPGDSYMTATARVLERVELTEVERVEWGTLGRLLIRLANG